MNARGIAVRIAVWIAVCMFTGGTALASFLANGGFESGLEHWEHGGNVTTQDSSPYTPAEGSRLIAFNAGDSQPNGWIRQSADNMTWRVNRLSFAAGSLSFNHQSQRLRVLVEEITDEGPRVLVDEVIEIPGLGDGVSHWQRHELCFTPVYSPITVSFLDVSNPTEGVDLLLDDVRLDGAHEVMLSSNIQFWPPPQVALDPASIEGLQSAQASAPVHYFPGQVVTFTADEVFQGQPFREWRLDGAVCTQEPTFVMEIARDAALTAVYGEGFLFEPGEALKVIGFAGSGPFSPLELPTTVTKLEADPVEWGLETDAPWLSLWPSSWDFGGGSNSVNVRALVTAKALDLPPGRHAETIRITSPAGDAEQNITLTALDPQHLETNGSFEASLDGWSAGGHVTTSGQAPYAATEGSRMAVFNSENSQPDGVLVQDMPTEAGARYRFRFDYGTLSYNTRQQHLQVEIGSAAEPFVANIASHTLTLTGSGGGKVAWKSWDSEFTALGPTTRVIFRDVSTETNGIDLLLDRVTLSRPDFVIEVTTLLDENDGAPGIGSGESLREALAESELRGGTNVIRFAPNLDGGLIVLGGSPLIAAGPLAIDASMLEAGITVSADGLSRVMETSGRVCLRGITLTGGAEVAEGAGIFNTGELMMADCRVTSNRAQTFGGGIYNYIGHVEAEGCEISHNASDAAVGGLYNAYGTVRFGNSGVSHNSAAGNGGGLGCRGLFSNEPILLENSTVAHNTAGGSGGAYCGFTGYKNSGLIEARNSTFADNRAAEAGGALAAHGYVKLSHCTVADNHASRGGGVADGGLLARFSIIAGNHAETDPNLSEFYYSQITGCMTDGDPQLDPLPPLFLNPVMKPRPGSPAIDAVPAPWSMPADDQRGYPRLCAEALDLGAVEMSQLVVNTLADDQSPTSLRGAMNESDSLSADWIRFDPSLAGGTITLAAGPLQIIGESMVIDAVGLPEGITISGNGASGAFQVVWGEARLGHLRIRDCSGSAIIAADSNVSLYDSIIENNSTTGNGGGLYVSMSGFGALVDVTRCTFNGNLAAGSGGAIHNTGLLFIGDSTFANNSSDLGGGAIHSGFWRGGSLQLENCTFAANQADGPGGAIEAGSCRMLHNTLTGNRSRESRGGGIASTWPPGTPVDLGFTVENSIIAGNSAPIDDDITGLIDPGAGGNLIGGNPLLAPLAAYGGPTPTMPPLPGSPAIEGGGIASSLPLDQRGAARPTGPLPDSGAVEAFPFSSLPLVDSDADGIDDRLEPAYGMIVGVDDSASDTDGDGSPDKEEIANMTDPFNPQNHLRITSVQVAAEGLDGSTALDITFPSFPGLHYTIECDPQLDFSGPAARSHALGFATGHAMTVRVPVLPQRDFLRVRRD